MNNYIEILKLLFKLSKMEIKNNLFTIRMMVLMPILLLFIGGASWGFSDQNAQLPADVSANTPFEVLFLIIINFLPIVLIAITSFLTGAKIKTMWLTPFYLNFGLFFIYLFQKTIDKKRLKNFFISFLFFFMLSPIIYSYISVNQTDKRTDYPGKDIAIKVQYVWDQQFDNPITIVLGNEWNAGNLSYHLKSRPSWVGTIDQNKINDLKEHICIDDVCVGFK